MVVGAGPTIHFDSPSINPTLKTVSKLADTDGPNLTTFTKAPNLNTAEATFDLFTTFYGRYGIDIFYNFEWNS